MHLLRSLYRRFASQERLFTLTMAVAVGIVAGAGSVAVRVMIEAVQWSGRLFTNLWEVHAGAAWPGVLLAPAVGGLLVGPLIYKFAREAKGHGVPEVMAAVLQKGGFIRPRVGLVKAVASAITIGSGGSVGREGPIIQIGSSIGSTIGYALHMPPRIMRTLVACGAAGGIAAAFNAPIAGALFAVEIILGDFGFIQLAPIVTSSVIATVVARSVEGNFAAFRVPEYALHHPLELVPYVVLGLACGVAAVAFIRTLDLMEQFFDRRVKVHDGLKPALGGLIVGGLGLLWPQVFGTGYEAMDQALTGGLPIGLLLVLVVAKLAATTATLASGGSGGIFAPSLFMGSMIGGAVGTVTGWLSRGASASSGAYALVGMSAMVGAATHAPITAIVIIFELTNDYHIILALMISTIIAVLTANTLERESIYTHKLRRMGIDIHQGLEANVLKQVRVRDVMRKDFHRVPEDLPFNFLMDVLVQTARSQIPVVDAQGRMVGVVSRSLARSFQADKNLLSDMVIARDVARKDFPALLPGDTLDLTMLRFQEHGVREMYVLDNLEERHVIGAVHKGDLTDAYQREMLKKSSGATFAYRINQPHRLETVKVMDGYGVIEVEAPHEFAGKALRELDLRNRYGVNVVAMKRPAPEDSGAPVNMWVPESGDRIQDGDVLVILGRIEKIEALQHFQ